MTSVFYLMGNSLVIMGTGVLTGSLIPIRKLTVQLSSGKTRSQWYIMSALIVLFIMGYMGYSFIFWSRHTTWTDLVVPAVFFFGSIFVWLAANLSLQTANDVRRMTVLEQETITDPLIGIYNRRYLDRRIDDEYDRARRYALPLSVLLVDIDHFKKINDTYGHQIGDLVLKKFGGLLMESIRKSDVAARYGGEEILIITPNTTASSAGILAERLRQQVENHELVAVEESKLSIPICITVSIGVAGLSQETANSRQLFNDADKALYRAKEEGRNRIVIYAGNFQEEMQGWLAPPGLKPTGSG